MQIGFTAWIECQVCVTIATTTESTTKLHGEQVSFFFFHYGVLQIITGQ